MQWITVVIETPRHSTGKYVYEANHHRYRLKKLLPLGMSFPYDFGLIKHTDGEDGDPLDAMVFTECDTFPGIEMKCRVIGALLATQQEPGKKKIRNDRYFFIPDESRVYDHIADIGDFSKQHNRELVEFFVNYNKIERKEFVPLQLINAAKALLALKKELD
jgi:inorganic pyrophosphatase